MMDVLSAETAANSHAAPASSQQFDAFLFDGKLKNFFAFKQFMDVLGLKAKQAQGQQPQQSVVPEQVQMGFEQWLLDGAHSNGRPSTRGAINVPGLSPSAALFGILDNLNGEQRGFVILQALLNGQVSQMMTPILLEEIDNSTLRDMLRAQLAQRAPPQDAQPRAAAGPATGGNALPYMALVNEMKEGPMRDMMLFQGVITGRIPQSSLPMVLEEMESDAMEKGLQLWAAQQSQAAPAGAAEGSSPLPAVMRGADLSTAAQMPNHPMSPAMFMEVLNNADGDLKDILIAQAVMLDQVPQYMFPSLLEQMDNSNIAQNLLIFKIQKQAADSAPAEEETTSPRGAGEASTGANQSLLNNPAALLPMLKQMDNGNMRDMLIAQMVVQNKVDAD